MALAVRESERLRRLTTMKQTPIHDNHNAELLALLPTDAARVVEVGCSSGALAREYRKLNPGCEYTGIEIDPDYAAAARAHCSRVLVGNVEGMSDAEFSSLLPVDCWIFGDVLEHLYDPWSALRRIRAASRPGATIVACIPNAQHWSVQVRMNSGEFRYEDSGLLDRTHIRWFTNKTIGHLFRSTGFDIVEGGGRVLREPYRDAMLEGVRAMASAIGGDPETAASDATPFQWLVRAVVPNSDRRDDPEPREMGQTALRDYYNPSVLALIPRDATRIVEVGCGGGSMAREYRKINPACEYVGIEIEPTYAEASRKHCTEVLTGNIEQLSDDVFGTLFPSSCWIFGDVLEHLHDPWAVLRRIRKALPEGASVIACVPNAQHWSIQTRLNSGDFWYEDIGLRDRTHIRWFTKTTLAELFRTTGFEIVEGGGLVAVELPEQQPALDGVRALAEVVQIDDDEAVANAIPVQWVVRAAPAPQED